MKIYFKYITILSFLFSLSSLGFSQISIGEKYETEERIKEEDFPKEALQLIKQIIKNGERLNFYKEGDSITYFYEVKTIYKEEKLSIKFTKEGSLIDIEILKDFDELPLEIQHSIKSYFQSNYKKHHLRRIQIQYNREEEYENGRLEIDDDKEFLEEFLEMDGDDLTIKYELEAEVVKKDKKRGFFEFLFNDLGEIEEIKRIIKRQDDNVLY
ncbi:hypothetical protein QYS48_01345 [Marivirga arenosa]|uniref:Uncharacterized protein n=1 Tax=Marivirga arenosa TaxID=3059076 RepID=A0AA49GF62_9BACT|nr:hypothetical protein [Marivirga sp. ABR2-2]WKK85767.2 hypothetical protein QYS48_01345 [Marivirga sp. ABR2-2]